MNSRSEGTTTEGAAADTAVVPEDQFTSPRVCPRTSSPCPWTVKSLKTVNDSTFCKQSVTYDRVKSTNPVIGAVQEVTAR